MARENDLGNDSIGSLVLKLAVPTMIAQFVNVLYSIIDRIYIGNIPGEGALALAGVGICGPIVTLLTSFGTLIGLGGSILMAMKMGEGNMKKAKQILSNSFLMLIIFSIVLTVTFFIIKDNLLMWFGASETTFPYADTYMKIYTAGTFFALMSLGLNYFINCQGFSTIGMATVLVGAVTNIILDPVFIFVFDMGVAGAAIATVIAQILSCLFALFFLFGKTACKNIFRRIFSRDYVKNSSHRSFTVFNFGYRQRYNDSYEYRASKNGRNKRRYAYCGCNYSSELYDAYNGALRRYKRRHTGNNQF